MADEKDIELNAAENTGVDSEKALKENTEEKNTPKEEVKTVREESAEKEKPEVIEEVGDEIDDDEIMDIDEAEAQVKKDAESKKSSRTDVLDTKPKRRGSKATDDFVKKQKRKKLRKRIIIIVILVLAAFFVITYLQYTKAKAAAALAAAASNSTEIATVEKKTLYDTTNATGTLYSLETRTMTANLGTGVATIDAVNVKVGDSVEAGDVLVQFSTEDIEKNIADTKEDISDQKQLDAITAADDQRTYVNSYTEAANSIQSAVKDVDSALFDLNEACNGYGEAKRALEDAKNKPLNTEVSMNSAEYYSAADREKDIKTAEAAVTAAYQKQESAQKAYEKAVDAQAKAVNTAQTSTLSKADSDYQKSQLNAGSKVKDYQRQLEKYEDSLDEYVVTASISGVVTEVNVSEGNRFSSGNVLTIQDNSGYKAEVLVDEYDIGKVKQAYNNAIAQGNQLKVVVKTEATEDREFTGHVTAIAPTSTSTTTAGTSTSSGGTSGASSSGSSSSSVNYKVSIELDDYDELLMIGMSAKVAIVTDESPADALCVPYNAIEEKSDGTFVVRLMDASYVKEKGLVPESGDPENGIVVENNNSRRPSDSFPNRGDSDDSTSSYFKWLFSKKDKDQDKQMDMGPKYKEITVTKIFDTDYYSAVVPTTAGAIKEGDSVMIVSNKSSGNDIMSMFGGGMGGGPDGGGPGGR